MAYGRLAETSFSNATELISAPQIGADFVLRGGYMQLQMDIEVQPEESKIIAPHDPLTGLPYPIFYTRHDYLLRKKNYHHLRHPKKARELGYDAYENDDGEIRYKLSEDETRRIEGKALRYSYGQLTPIYLHDRYHDIFRGSNLPKSRASKFVGTLLPLAEVTPRTAIDLSTPGEFYLRDLTDDEYSFLAGRRRIYFEKARGGTELEAVAKRDVIGQFFASYAIEQSLSLPVEMLEEFLHTKKQSVRRRLGREILNEAIGVSVAELVPLHAKAKDEGMADQRIRSLGSIVRKFFPEKKFPDYYPALENTARLVLS